MFALRVSARRGQKVAVRRKKAKLGASSPFIFHRPSTDPRAVPVALAGHSEQMSGREVQQKMCKTKFAARREVAQGSAAEHCLEPVELSSKSMVGGRFFREAEST